MRSSFRDYWSLPLKDVFSNKKVVENHLLNYAGAQILRVLLSSTAYSFRRMTQSWPKTKMTKMLRKKGFIIIPNFLSQKSFKKVKDEFNNTSDIGYHSPIKDGDTFVDRYTFPPNQWKRLPAVTNLLSHSLLVKTLEGAELDNIDIGDVWFDTIYCDDSQKLSSSQNQLHSDTFYTTHKVWYFIEPVKLKDGPLCFVPGSNRLSLKNLIFEYNKSIHFDELTPHERRVLTRDETFLGCKEKAITCLDNTLVIANTRGFHYRGKAERGSTRKQIHFCIRTNKPFSFY